jgi:hypothetical protein
MKTFYVSLGVGRPSSRPITSVCSVACGDIEVVERITIWKTRTLRRREADGFRGQSLKARLANKGPTSSASENLPVLEFAFRSALRQLS